MLYVETGLAPIFIYTLKLHVDYICKIMTHQQDRLTQKVARIIISKRALFVKQWEQLSENYEANLDIRVENVSEWKDQLYGMIQKIDTEYRRHSIVTAKNSLHRNSYNELCYDFGENNYFNDKYSIKSISAIFKARGELWNLGYVPHRNPETTICSLCNTGQTEDIIHFIAYCPMLKEIRHLHFQKITLSHEEAREYLNGKQWNKLADFTMEAFSYRKKILMGDF